MTEEKKELTFQNRNLMEISIDQAEREDSKELIKWLENHATAPHAEVDEFFLWIPSAKGYKTQIRATYGKEIPDYINSLLVAAINVRKDNKDQGYLLIIFV